MAVLCGAHSAIAQETKNAAYRLGEYLGKNQHGLLMGGVDKGLMRQVFEGYQSQEPLMDKFAVIAMEKYERPENKLINGKNIITVPSLHKRLEYFYHHAEAFIFLPGGFGTMHELVDSILHLNATKIPIIILNIDNTWNDLLRQFHSIIQNNIEASKHMRTVHIFDTLEECLIYLNTISAITGK